jgi:cysteine desulfurase
MWQKNVRYLDYNATSGLSVSVREKLIELLARPETLANPSSRHRLGQSARKILHDASVRVAKSLSNSSENPVSIDDLLFTSSGTEANQTVLKSIAEKASLTLIGAGEHSSSRDWAADFSKSHPHFQTDEIPLLPNGEVDLQGLEKLLRNAKTQGHERVGVSLTLANNETGVLLDNDLLKDLFRKMHTETGVSVILHLDASQAWGKIAFDVRNTSANFITFSAHKIGAPSGTGVIWRSKDAFLSPLMIGTQSRGLRGGSENLIGIAATGFAAETLDANRFEKHTRPLIAQLETGLKKMSHPIRIWGEESPRVPNTSRFSFQHFKTYENWVELLDLKGFAVSHGSACKAQIIEPSHVLLKMGASAEDALNSLRISVGPENTQEDISEFLIALQSILAQKEAQKS